MMKKDLFIKLLPVFIIINCIGSRDAFRPVDCNDPSIIRDGEYLIYPYGSNPISVYCEQARGGAWTRILNKVDRTKAFNRRVQDYIEGFGEPQQNYWFGLDNIRGLVEQRPYTLRLELSNGPLETYFVEYDFFYIHSADKNYKLNLGKYLSGSLLDTFKRMDNNEFSFNNSDCGEMYNAGWWFDSDRSCYSVCLTCEKNFNGNEGHWLNYNWLIFSNMKMLIRQKEPYRPANCFDIYQSDGVKKDGVYNIYPTNSVVPLRAYCEMNKGGWTRVLNKADRTNGSFEKTWSDYAEGFGDLERNSWLGLRHLVAMTHRGRTSLRIEIHNDQSDPDFIEYDSFLVSSEKKDFELEIGAKSLGTLDDHLITHNKLKFSTFDKRNDGNLNCAKRYGGGWWYKAMNPCYAASLTSFDTQWGLANMNNQNLPKDQRTFIRMMIKPNL